VVCGGGGGFSGGSEADQVLSRAAEGGEHGVVCREGGAFAGWSGKEGVLGSDSWEASSLPALGGGTQQEAAWAQAIGGASGMEKEVMERERNTLVRVATERVLEVQGLRECLTQMEGQPMGEAEGRGQVPEGDALWVELEAARWREDWLANEAASGRTGILCWVREHQVLLDGASVDSGWFDAGVHSSASGVAAGDGVIGEVVGRASATQCGGPRVMVGGGG
ncbi:hypothetical protein C0989_006003, partial [Termitomyces sp. Mn162]